MSFAFRQGATGTGASPTSCTLGSTPIQGDLMLMSVIVVGIGTTPSITTPSGWTLLKSSSVASSSAGAFYWKLAGASESTTPSVSWSNGNSARIVVTEWTGASGSGTIVVSGITETSPAAGTTLSFNSPSVSAGSGNNAVLLFVSGGSTGSVTSSSPPSGYTSQFESNTAHEVSLKNTTTSGTEAPGAESVTYNASSTADGYVCLVIVKPGTVFTQSLTGTLSFTGAWSWGHAYSKALTASLSFSGAIVRQTQKSLSGALSFVGNQPRFIKPSAMTAALSFSGALNGVIPLLRQIIPLTGGLTGAIRGYLFKSSNHNYYALPGGVRKVITSAGTVPVSTPFNPQASIPPVTGMPAVTWTQSAGAGPATDAITFTTASSFTAVFSDGTQITLSQLNQTISNLTNGDYYGFMVAWNKNTGAWAIFTGPASTTSAGATLTAAQRIANGLGDGWLVSLDNQVIQTLAANGSGGGGGGGGGGGSKGGCPAAWQIIERKDKDTGRIALVPASELRVGDYLRDPFVGWNRIRALLARKDDVYRLRTTRGDTYVNKTHGVMNMNSDWAIVTDLREGVELMPPIGEEAPVVLGIDYLGVDDIIDISCEHFSYVLPNGVGHNITL